MLWTWLRELELGLEGRSKGLDHIFCLAWEEPKLHAWETEASVGKMPSFGC